MERHFGTGVFNVCVRDVVTIERDTLNRLFVSISSTFILNLVLECNNVAEIIFVGRANSCPRVHVIPVFRRLNLFSFPAGRMLRLRFSSECRFLQYAT